MSPKLKAIFDKLDLAPVTAAVASIGEGFPWEKQGAADKILAFSEAFLIHDLENWDSCEVEKEFGIDPSETAHGFLDLVLSTSTKSIIADWKTTGALDRPNFKVLIIHDPQTAIYLGYGLEKPPEYLQYRVIDDNLKIEVINVLWEPKYRAQAGEALFDANLMQAGFDEEERWAQNKPWGCFQGSKTGPTCPFWDDCLKPHAYSKHPITEGPIRSKSALKDFLHCPEYYRRTRLCGDEGRPSIEASVGQAVHVGMSEIYRQAFELKEKGKI